MRITLAIDLYRPFGARTLLVGDPRLAEPRLGLNSDRCSAAWFRDLRRMMRLDRESVVLRGDDRSDCQSEGASLRTLCRRLPHYSNTDRFLSALTLAWHP